MSQYVVVKTNLKDAECLRQALIDCGCQSVEMGQEGLRLKGYQNDRTAELVVRKQSIGVSADIGFKLNSDGTYALIVDSDDKTKVSSLLRGLNQQYACNLVMKQAKIHHYNIVKTKKGQSIKLTLRSWRQG